MCTLSVVPTPEREDIKHLLVTRLRKNEEPLVLKLLLPNEKDESDAMVEDFQVCFSNSLIIHELQ